MSSTYCRSKFLSVVFVVVVRGRGKVRDTCFPQTMVTYLYFSRLFIFSSLLYLLRLVREKITPILKLLAASPTFPITWGLREGCSLIAWKQNGPAYLEHMLSFQKLFPFSYLPSLPIPPTLQQLWHAGLWPHSSYRLPGAPLGLAPVFSSLAVS